MGLPNVLPNSIYIRISRCIIPSLARLYPPSPPRPLINSLSWPSFQFINPFNGLSMQIADSYQSRRQIVNIQLCAVISNFSSDHPTPHEAKPCIRSSLPSPQALHNIWQWEWNSTKNLWTLVGSNQWSNKAIGWQRIRNRPGDRNIWEIFVF